MRKDRQTDRQAGREVEEQTHQNKASHYDDNKHTHKQQHRPHLDTHSKVIHRDTTDGTGMLNLV